MPDGSRGTHPVTIAGLLRGTDLAGEGSVALGGGTLILKLSQRTLNIPLASLEGMRVRSGTVELFAQGGDVICLTPATGLDELARELLRHVYALPEMTLSLRGLGSRRAGPDQSHDRFFAPLLAARRRAEEASALEEALAALEAAALRDAFGRQLAAFASERYAADPGERRALEAELTECAEGLFASLADLESLHEAVVEGEELSRFARWRDWVHGVRRVFECADACWFAVQPLLAHSWPARAPRWRRWLRQSGGAALATLLVPAAAGAQHVSLRIAGVPAESLRARDFDVVSARPGFVVVVADSADRARLARLGWSGTPIAPPGADAARLLGRRAATVTSVYRPFDDPARGIVAWLDSLARVTRLVHLDTIGLSVEGRPIIIAKIGEADDSPSRPNVLFMATYHAREWAATEMALRLIRHLSHRPAPDARIESLVSNRDIWILPVANPDGYQYTFTTDRLWRKNRRPNGDGSFGVDLNRNHAAFWGLDNRGSSPTPTAETYRGPAAESEPETRAIVAFHAAHPPVMAVSYHSFTGLILYPWGHEFGEVAGDQGIFRALAGTDVQPAVRDRLPAPERPYYHPAPGWNLYVTNGEYTDWAYATYGSIAFTPELTSGYENGQYYGFEFPDDEARLQTLFEDNLPFALDVLDAAADPLGARPVATGIPSERIGLESVSPVVRVRVPVAEVGSTEVYATDRLPLAPDTAGGGRYTRRLISAPIARPSVVTISVRGRSKLFSVLAASGAEVDERGWSASGFLSDTARVVGARAWAGGEGTLRSPEIRIPDRTDSVSVLFWTRYLGDPFSLVPHGEVRVSADDGRTWTPAAVLAGSAPEYYPERADITGVAGESIRVEFNANFGPGARWWLDEITVVAHGPGPDDDDRSVTLRASENPVRGTTVFFAWPFGAEAGDVMVYDFRGRLVWRQHTDGTAETVAWNVGESGARNGVYVAVARARGRTSRLKLFVARRQS